MVFLPSLPFCPAPLSPQGSVSGSEGSTSFGSTIKLRGVWTVRWTTSRDLRLGVALSFIVIPRSLPSVLTCGFPPYTLSHPHACACSRARPAHPIVQQLCVESLRLEAAKNRSLDVIGEAEEQVIPYSFGPIVVLFELGGSSFRMGWCCLAQLSPGCSLLGSRAFNSSRVICNWRQT